MPLYQRYDFEIAVEGDVPDEGPDFWFMRRRPHPITPSSSRSTREQQAGGVRRAGRETTR